MGLDKGGNKMKNRFIILFSLLIALAFLASCEVATEPDPDLDGTSWIVIEINGNPVPEGIMITSHFADGVIGGEAPCNVYSAEYTQSGSEMSIDPPIMTQMYCDEENVMETEEGFTLALDKVRQVELEGGLLFMQDAGGDVILLLEREPS